MTVRRAIVGSSSVPQPDRDRGSKVIDDLIRFLQEAGWQVTFVTATPPDDVRHVRDLERRGVAVLHGTVTAFEDLVAAVSYDVAILAFWPTAELYLPILRRLSPRTRVIVDSIDLHFLRHARKIVCVQRPAKTFRKLFSRDLHGERCSDGNQWSMVHPIGRKTGRCPD